MCMIFFEINLKQYIYCDSYGKIYQDVNKEIVYEQSILVRKIMTNIYK